MRNKNQKGDRFKILEGYVFPDVFCSGDAGTLKEMTKMSFS
jgi:hypothetical protein